MYKDLDLTLEGEMGGGYNPLTKTKTWELVFRETDSFER